MKCRPLYEWASKRKRTKKHFVIAFVVRIRYTRGPPPLLPLPQSKQLTPTSKTNNKIKPMSIASQLRYVSMYVQNVSVFVIVCNGGGGGKMRNRKKKMKYSKQARRNNNSNATTTTTTWDDIRVYRHRKLVSRSLDGNSDSGWGNGSGQGGWQRTYTYIYKYLSIYVYMNVLQRARKQKQIQYTCPPAV